MGEFLGDYIAQNWIDLLFSFIIAIVVSLIFVKKDPNSSIKNKTDITYVKKIIVIKKSEHGLSKKIGDNKYDDSTVFILIFILGLIVTYLFIKYFSAFLDIYTLVTVFILTAVLSIAIILYRNNQYDNLNRFWTFLMLIITVFNLWHIKIMSEIDLSDVATDSLVTMINSVGLSGMTEYLYNFIGFFIGILLNIIAILLLIYMLSLNNFLFGKGRISKFIIRNVIIFTKPIQLLIIVICLIILSLLFSSDMAYNFIRNMNG